MAKKRKPIKRKVRRAKPGPRAGSKYQSAEQIKLALIDATENLLSEGIVVASLSSRQITQRAGVDKMYVNRYFGDLVAAGFEDGFGKWDIVATRTELAGIEQHVFSRFPQVHLVG